MKKTTAILIAVILIAVIILSVFAGYKLYYAPEGVTQQDGTQEDSAQEGITQEGNGTQEGGTQEGPITSGGGGMPSLPQYPREPRIVTVVDDTGASVTVTLPVKRIIALTMLGTVYLLGAGDRVVGRGYMTPQDIEESPLPGWLLEKPDCGNDWNPNMELIMELNPDLVLASRRLPDENRRKLEDAGIAVIEDTLMWPRRYDCIYNLGLILEAEAKAEELIAYEMYYVNLVKERVETLPRTSKPLVFFEWYRPFFSAGQGSTYEVLIVAAGGINIAENVTVVAPQLSAEWVAERNPDIIVRMLTYMDGLDLAAFQRLRDDIMSRPGISHTNAVKNGKVYIARDSILVGAEWIGLLYLAKWFHPDTFQDIDPAAIHAEFIQRFYGTQLKGIHAYP